MNSGWDMSSVLKYLVVGLVALVIMVALLPTILGEIGKLQGTVAGYCQVTVLGTLTGSPPVGTMWQLGQPWFDGRYPTSVLPTGADTGGTCEKLVIGTPFPVPTNASTFYYIPTATSENGFLGIMLTVITLMPVLLVLGLVVWALRKFGVLGGGGGGGGPTAGGAGGGGRGKGGGDAN